MVVSDEKLDRAFWRIVFLLYKILAMGRRYLSRDVYEIPIHS